MGGGPPSSSFLTGPIYSHWQVLRSFSGTDSAAGKADEAAGPTPGSEDHAASRSRCPEKPRCPLSTEGTDAAGLDEALAGDGLPGGFRRVAAPAGVLGPCQGEAAQRRFQELEPEAWQRLLDSGTAGARELLDAYAACGRIGSGLFIWTVAMMVLFT